MNIFNQQNVMNNYKKIVRNIIECIFENYKF